MVTMISLLLISGFIRSVCDKKSKNHTEPRWAIYPDGSHPCGTSVLLRNLQINFKAGKRKGYLKMHYV